MRKINNNIFLGISTGVTIVSLIGFFTMTAAYFEKNKELAEALKEKKETARIDNANNNQDQALPAKVDIKASADDWFRGDKNASVTIIEFSDFQCPYCARFHSAMQETIKNNKNVKWVFKHFALPSHSFGRKSALAAECAGEQGKFWEYTDGLFANQSRISDGYFSELAQGLKLNASKFSSCLASEKYASKVDGDQAAGQAAGVSATPTSFANGQKIMGALSAADLKNIIVTVQAGSRLQN